MWIRKGFDPCREPDAKKFQVIDFRTVSELTRPLPQLESLVLPADTTIASLKQPHPAASSSSSNTGSGGDAATPTLNNSGNGNSSSNGAESPGEVDTLGSQSASSRAMRNYLRQMMGFTMPPLKCQFYYCFYEIQMPSLRFLIDRTVFLPPAPDSDGSGRSGWLTPDIYKEIRTHMKAHLPELGRLYDLKFGSPALPPGETAAAAASLSQPPPRSLQIEGFALFE
jgi:hypothetical protein